VPEGHIIDANLRSSSSTAWTSSGTLVDDGLGLRVGLPVAEAGALGCNVSCLAAWLNFRKILRLFLEHVGTSISLRPATPLANNSLNRPPDRYALRVLSVDFVSELGDQLQVAHDE